MARVLRGDIYWADLGAPRGHEQGGERPVLVISHDVFNERSQTAIVLAITSVPQRAGFPLTLPIESVPLPKPSWVKISQVRTLATSRLKRRLGRLSDEELSKAMAGLNEIVA